jgi:hypothetical protein
VSGESRQVISNLVLGFMAMCDVSRETELTQKIPNTINGVTWFAHSKRVRQMQSEMQFDSSR